jgi:tape measure domain-containing protein
MNMDTAIKFTTKVDGQGLDQLKRGLQGLAQQSNRTSKDLDQLYAANKRLSAAAGTSISSLQRQVSVMTSLRNEAQIGSRQFKLYSAELERLQRQQAQLAGAASGSGGVSGLMAVGGGLKALGGLALGAGILQFGRGVATAGMEAEAAQVRLKALTSEYGEYNRAVEITDRIQKTLRLSTAEAQDGFAKLYAGLRPTGVTMKEMEAIFVGFSAAARVSGATAQETASAMIQLKQSLVAGRAQGDELRSILENAPALGQAVAEQMTKLGTFGKVTRAQLKELGADGKISTDVLIEALKQLGETQLPKLKDQFNTGQQAVTDFQNATKDLFAEISKLFGPAVVKGLQLLTNLLKGAADSLKGANIRIDAAQQARQQTRKEVLEKYNLGDGGMGSFFKLLVNPEAQRFEQRRFEELYQQNLKPKQDTSTPGQSGAAARAEQEREATAAAARKDALKDELKIRQDAEDKLADAALDHARELAEFRKQTAKQVADYERDLGDQRLTLERSIGEARRRVAATEKDMALESEKQRRAALGLSTEAIDFQKQLNDETRRFTEENIKIEQQASDRNRDLARKLEEFKLQVSDTAGKIQEGYARKVSDILQDAGRKLAAQMEKGAASAAATLSSAGGGTATPGSVPAGSLGTSRLVQLAKSAGFGANDAAIMAAIAMAESGGRSGAHNNNASTGDNSYGLWQINMLGGMGPQRRRQFGIAENDALFDPATNANAARAVFGSQGFGAWSVYRSGAYKQFLPEAQAAAAAGVAGGQPYRVGDTIPQSATGATAAGPAPGSFAGDAAKLMSGLAGSVEKTKELSDAEKRAQQEANINQLISSRQSALTQVTSQLDGQTKSIGDQLRDQLRINDLIRSGINPEVAKARVEAENSARLEYDKLTVLRDQLTLDLQENTLTEAQRIKVEKILADTILRQQAQKGIVEGVVAENAKLVQLNDSIQRNKQLAEGIASSIGNGLGSAMDVLINGTKNWGNSLREIGATVLRDIARQIMQIMVIQPIVKGISAGLGGLFKFADGGIMTDAGPVPLRKYARGGIASGPQMALYGEGSMPEAYVPLPDGRRIPVAMKGGGGGSTNVTVNVDASGGSQVQGNPGQAEALGRVVSQAVQNELLRQKRPGGLLAA